MLREIANMYKSLLISVILLAGLSGAAFAEDFAFSLKLPADGSVVKEHAVVRGDRDVWRFSGERHKTLFISLTSLERNASIYVCNSKTQALVPAMVSDGIKSIEWSGELPVSGEYDIVVSPTRGNASYRMSVELIDLGE